MRKLWLVQQPAQKGRYDANVRILRAFSAPAVTPISARLVPGSTAALTAVGHEFSAGGTPNDGPTSSADSSPTTQGPE